MAYKNRGYPEKGMSQYLLTKADLPLTFSTKIFNPDFFIDDCCKLLDLDSATIQLEFIEDIRDLNNVPWEIEGKPFDSKSINTNGLHKIFLAHSVKKYPKSAIYNLTKELIRIRMIENEWEFNTGEDTELFLIIASVYYRLGLIISCSSSEFSMVNTFSLFSKLIDEKEPNWINFLDSNNKELYGKANSYLDSFPSRLVDLERLNRIDLWNKSDILYKEDKLEEAIELLQKVIFLTNDSLEKTSALNNVGYYLTLLEKYRESINYFKKAIALDPTYLYAYDNLGYALIMSNELDKAYDIIQHTIYLPERDLGYFNRNLALYYKATNALEKAEYHFQIALKESSISYVCFLAFHYCEFLIHIGKTGDFENLLRPSVQKGEKKAIELAKKLNLEIHLPKTRSI